MRYRLISRDGIPGAVGLCAAAACLVAARSLPAGSGPPWRAPADLPVPEGAKSLLIVRANTPVLRAPSDVAERRGTALAGARLPVFGVLRAAGCEGRYVNVGPWAWVCQDGLDFDPGPFDAPDLEGESWGNPGERDGLPYRYFIVGQSGANGYGRIEDAERVSPDREFEPGFILAAVEERERDGVRFVRQHHGLWVPLQKLVPVSSPEPRGELVYDGRLDFGWVVADAVLWPTSRPAKAPPRAAPRLGRWARLSFADEPASPPPEAYRLAEGQWVRASDVRRPSRSEPPASVHPGERWIDVELASQTLVAYEGETPVFATLVSGGKGKEGTDSATPKGEFRIWVKLTSSDMDNLEHEDAERFYSIEDVPYVQYFSNGVALHGAFWHRDFGRPRSHGYVNLAPLDARWLFRFTSPHLPAGWNAVLPVPDDPGTVVRVR